MVDDRQLGLLGGQRLEDVAGAVRGAVVDEDDLLRHGNGLDAVEDLAERVPLVVDRDNDREHKVVGDSVDAQVAADGFAQDAEQDLTPLLIVGRKGHGIQLVRPGEG